MTEHHEAPTSEPAAAPAGEHKPAAHGTTAHHPKPAAKKAKPAAPRKPKAAAPKKSGGAKKARKEAEKARARGWAAAGIGAGIGIGSLAAAMLYANRLRKGQQPSPAELNKREPEES